MSESLNRLNIVKVRDHRLASGELNNYAVLESAQNVTRRVYNSTSISGSSLSFNNINPPNAKVFVDRQFNLNITYEVKINGQHPTGNILDDWGYSIAPRVMPINNSFSSISLQLNTATFNQDKNDILPAETRSCWKRNQSYLTQSCVATDQSQQYDELLDTIRNPLSSLAESEPDAIPPRGAINTIKVYSNTSTYAHFDISFTEPIMISPLSWDNTKDNAFVHLTNVTFAGVFDSNLTSRVLSVANNTYNSGYTYSVVPKSSTMAFVYYDAPLGMSIPPSVTYSYYPVNRFITDNITPLASSASSTLTINNIQLSSIPKRIYIFIKETRSTITPKSTDTFCRINNVSIEFMNRSSLLASASPQQLYQMSKQNNIDLTWDQWYGTLASDVALINRKFSGVGSLICIDPVSDLGLPDYMTSGTTTNVQLQCTVSYSSLQPTGIASKLYSANVIIIDDGLCTLQNGVAYQQNSVVAPSDLIALVNQPYQTTDQEMKGEGLTGGNFFSNIKSFWNSNKHWLMPIARGISSAVKVVQPETAPFLSAVGLGTTGGCYGKGLVGGAKISKKKLLQLMR